ncbi:uncharacterized protein LOC128225956 [Mya arenaria]|uniref:uncharacterized protein LOC128225956 n=1 Tax=Mya arenaria TaxID=6604 RepID=UPI0022E0B5A4|nr:uncharacterized protein LOC128225956 [Mya arenaria]
MSSQESLEIRANIKFCKEIGKTPSETYKLLMLTRGDSCVCRALVFKWHRRYSDGRQSLEDDAGRGRKSTIGPSAVTSIDEKLEADCRMTVRELSEAATVSYGTAHSILTTELNMRKVLGRDLIRALRKNRGDISVDQFILHQDNAPPHTAATTQLEISVLGLEVIPLPLYSPDLAPFDFAIFPKLKSHPKGRRLYVDVDGNEKGIKDTDSEPKKTRQIEEAGVEAYANFKEKYSQDYLSLMRKFEHKKYGFLGDKGQAVVAIQVPFSDKHLVIIPAKANVAIMKGAVIYGREENLIETRICKNTFGLDWNEDFDPRIHPVSKRECTDDGYMCKDIFKVIAKVGDAIASNTPTQIIKSYVKTASQTVMEFPFYRTLTDPPPMFIDDESCTFMGSMKISLEDTTGGIDRFVTLKIFIGATTLNAQAIDNKGRTHRATLLLEKKQQV